MRILSVRGVVPEHRYDQEVITEAFTASLLGGQVVASDEGGDEVGPAQPGAVGHGPAAQRVAARRARSSRTTTEASGWRTRKQRLCAGKVRIRSSSCAVRPKPSQ